MLHKQQQQQQQQQQVEQLGIAKPAAAPVRALRRCISSNRNGNKAHKQRRKRENEHIARRAAPAASCFFESVPLGAGLQQKTCSAAAQQLEFPAWKTARRAAIFAGSKAAAAAVPIKTQPCDGLKPEQKKAEIRAPGADFAKKRRVAGFLSYLARSAPPGPGHRPRAPSPGESD